MFKTIFFVVLVIILFAFSARASSQQVVINEVMVSGETATFEYVKLYNTTDSEISLANFRLTKQTTSGSKYNLVSIFPESAKIQPKSYFLIAHKDYTFESDLNYSTNSYSLADSNAVVLYSDAGKTEVDRVAYGANTFAEGQPAQNPKPNEILKRKVDGVDTDNNQNDFVVLGILNEEQESEEEDGFASDISGVLINEILPDPKSPKSDSLDEWIELFNSNENSVDLSGAVLRDSVGTVREYVIPEGVKIDGGRFATFYSSATKLSLNNSGDSVELLDASRKIADKSPNYGKAKSDHSYARFSEGWDWTLEPTPLNVNTQVVVEKVENKKAFSLPKKDTKKITPKAAKEKSKKESKAKAAKSKEVKAAKVAKKDESLGSNNDKIGNDGEFLGWNNDLLGKILIFGGILLAINYLIFREMINEIFKQKLKGDS